MTIIKSLLDKIENRLIRMAVKEEKLFEELNKDNQYPSFIDMTLIDNTWVFIKNKK